MQFADKLYEECLLIKSEGFIITDIAMNRDTYQKFTDSFIKEEMGENIVVAKTEKRVIKRKARWLAGVVGDIEAKFETLIKLDPRLKDGQYIIKYRPPANLPYKKI